MHPVQHSVSSGLFRLSCPKLVQAIDKWEREGAISDFNDRLQSDEQWRHSYAEANAAVAAIRQHVIYDTSGGREKVRRAMLCVRA